jgi:hypothetical protein
MKFFTNEPNLPNYARDEYREILPDLTLIADEIAGTRRMHEKSTEYIRKWGAEKKGNYKIRRECETFFEGFGRTLSAAVGMLFAKGPDLEWNQAEAAMSPHWDNIDGMGANGPVFVKRFAEAAVRDGISLILVDHPVAPKQEPTEDNPEGTVTGDLEERLNLRPLWSKYNRLQAINWMVEVVNNRATVTQLTLVESAAVREGAYGVKTVLRYRDLRLGVNEDGVRVASWILREVTDESGQGEGSFRIVGQGDFRNRQGEQATFLPVAIAYTGRSDAPMDAAIPLLGVAWANLAHWQLSTSLRFNSEVAGFAQPTVIGELASDPQTGRPVDLEIGPLVTVQVTEGGDFKWSEPAGTGLERLALLVLEKLHQIAAMGVSFLQRDTRAAETAEAKRLDAAAENATLATAATGIEDAVNVALEIHAWYLGIDKVNAPVLTLSRDFEATTMSADIMTAYVRAVHEASLPIRILLESWQQGGRIQPDTDLDKLELEMMAGMEAARQEREVEAELEREEVGAGVP